MPSESVEVLFNYKYDTSEGRHITITKGDVFTLLAKSTEEWWKVRRGEREKFYVPANYVRVLSSENGAAHMRESKQKGASDSISINTDIPQVTTENGHSRDGSTASNNDSADNQSRSDSFGSQGEGYTHGGMDMDRTATLPKPNITPATPPKPEMNGVTYINSSMLKLDLKPTITISPDVSPSPENELPAYANMTIIQEIIAQRKENESLRTTDSSTPESWEMHTDEDTGKPYFFNPVTKETTWDSPVIKRRSNLSAKEVLKPPSSPATSKRLSRITSFRKGWTETISDDGTPVYVHNATGEKWHMAIDSSGKEYYYKENSQESLWELPEVWIACG